MIISNMNFYAYRSVKTVEFALSELRHSQLASHKDIVSELLISNIYFLVDFIKGFSLDKNEILFTDLRFGTLLVKEKGRLPIAFEEIVSGIVNSKHSFTKIKMINGFNILFFQIDHDVELECDADSLLTIIKQIVGDL